MTVAYWCAFIVAILPYVWSMSWRWPVYSFEANLADIGVLRSLAFAGGGVCTIAIFLSAV